MNPFTEEDYKKLKDFIQRYDTVHASIEALEEILQSALANQKKYVEELEAVRQNEESFFQSISEREGLPILELKKLATAWAMEKK